MEADKAVLSVTDDYIKIRKSGRYSVDAECLNDALLTLPAETYIELFHEMSKKIYGYQSFAVANSGCNCSGTCGEPEEKEN